VDSLIISTHKRRIHVDSPFSSSSSSSLRRHSSDAVDNDVNMPLHDDDDDDGDDYQLLSYSFNTIMINRRSHRPTCVT